MSLKKSATSGFAWTFAQQFGHQIIGFFVSLILARILLPEEFGLIGMIAILIGLGRALFQSGMTQSLIRAESCDNDDYSTVFYSNFIFACIIYVAFYFIAPYVAEFYRRSVLVHIIRLYSIIFIINSFSAVQFAKLTRDLNFRIQAFIEIPSTVIGGAVGIVMAYMDYGVFSLVWAQVASSIASTVQVWIYTRWIPYFRFLSSKFQIHFNFGYKIAISSMLDVLFKNSYILVIGKFYSAMQVGFYTRAETMKQLPVNNVSSTLSKVTLPLISRINNDDTRLKNVHTQILEVIIFIVAPILIFAAILAEPLFRFLFTAKWLPAVAYFQILCMTGILSPVQTYNLNLLKAKGRSDLFLKLNIVEKLTILISLIIGYQFGLYGILFSQVFVSIVIFYINAFYTNKLINYSALDQIKTIAPAITLTIVCGLFVYYLDLMLSKENDLLRIISGAGAGGALYLLGSWIFKMKSLRHLWSILKMYKK